MHLFLAVSFLISVSPSAHIICFPGPFSRGLIEKVTKEISQKQQNLLDTLIERLAMDLAEGVLPELMLGSDEYGQNLFPIGGLDLDSSCLLTFRVHLGLKWIC